MKLDNVRVEESSFDHNHEADSERQLMQKVVGNACKRRATEDLFERPRKVMRKKMTIEALEVLTETDICIINLRFS